MEVAFEVCLRFAPPSDFLKRPKRPIRLLVLIGAGIFDVVRCSLVSFFLFVPIFLEYGLVGAIAAHATCNFLCNFAPSYWKIQVGVVMVLWLIDRVLERSDNEH